MKKYIGATKSLLEFQNTRFEGHFLIYCPSGNMTPIIYTHRMKHG